jgi:hypothetical protein
MLLCNFVSMQFHCLYIIVVWRILLVTCIYSASRWFYYVVISPSGQSSFCWTRYSGVYWQSICRWNVVQFWDKGGCPWWTDLINMWIFWHHLLFVGSFNTQFLALHYPWWTDLINMWIFGIICYLWDHSIPNFLYCTTVYWMQKLVNIPKLHPKLAIGSLSYCC